jgi:NhaA family Na+:H+ antiporter
MPATPGPGGRPSPAGRLEHHVRPWSAAVAAPVFAFVAAGVPLAGHGGAVAEPVVWGVLLGLVVGKPVGVIGTTALLTRFTRLRPPGGLRARDLWGVGLLAGVGFTVSLLVASLAFDDARLRDDATLAVFAGSLLSALGAALLLRRGRRGAGTPAVGLAPADPAVGRGPAD